LQKIGLADLLELCQEKYPQLDSNLILKSLVYFNDITEEPIDYKNNHAIDFQKIETELRSKVKDFLNQETEK
jgi:hypothetical protein